MILCYKTGPAGARLPITAVRMETEGSVNKGEEVVRCVCGLSIPVFGGSTNMVAARRRGEPALRGVVAVKPLHCGPPKNYEPLMLDEDEFNFLPDSGVESLNLFFKYA